MITGRFDAARLTMSDFMKIRIFRLHEEYVAIVSDIGIVNVVSENQ